MSNDPTPAEISHFAALLALWSIVAAVLTMLFCGWMLLPHLAFFAVAPFPIALGFWLASSWTHKLR